MINKLHYLTQDLPSISHIELADKVCKAGIRWIQLRMKNKTQEESAFIANEVQKICKIYNCTLIINDDVFLAKRIDADGVHLGQEDMSIDEARKILGNDKIIGGTANTFEDINQLAIQQVDYIGLGPFRFTQTKQNLSPVIGLKGYKEIVTSCHKAGINIPIIGIGGIKLNDVESLLNTGLCGIAISSSINKSANPSKAAKNFSQKIKTYNATTNYC